MSAEIPGNLKIELDGFEQAIYKQPISKVTTVCMFPYKVYAKGLWDKIDIAEATVTILGLEIVTIYVVTQLLYLILKPLRQPKIVSQILGGIIVGSSGLARYIEIRRVLFPMKNILPLRNFASLGLMLFQFLLGVKMDPSIVMTSGRKTFIIGISALVFPNVIAGAFNVILPSIMTVDKGANMFMGFTAMAQSMSAFSVVACLLTELKILNSELGRLALSSSLVCDLCYNFLATMIMNWNISTSQSPRQGLTGTLGTLAFVLIVVFAARPMFIWVIRQTPVGEPVRELYIILILLAVLVSGFISVVFGQQMYFGPFILGLVVPDGPPLGSTLINKLEDFTTGILLPLFMIVSGLRMNVVDIEPRSYFIIYTSIVSFISKFGGVMIPAMLSGLQIQDAIPLALIMSSKGIVELATFNSWLETKLINESAYAVLCISVLVVAGICAPLLRFLYDPSRKYAGYNKRTIEHNKQYGELRILPCIHDQENVPFIIKLMEASNPTRESPLHVYALHLVELVGRAAPVLISHNMWKVKTSSKPSISEHIVNAFRHFDEQNPGVLAVQAYTAISPYDSMHEDICLLALDKRASLIVLPFHKQWDINGTISSSKSAIRTLNYSVLDKAPCSVALLIDRGHVTSSSNRFQSDHSYRVAMLFLGGADDRETLAYAKRMTLGSDTINLKVIRLIPSDNSSTNKWQSTLDDEAIKEFRLDFMENSHVEYIEEVVADGEQTASIIRSVEHSSDLIMVGRRYGVFSPLTAGFTEWSECPELGDIGDMIVSSASVSGVSVLVVQQQVLSK